MMMKKRRRICDHRKITKGDMTVAKHVSENGIETSKQKKKKD